jgi:acyl carrier protein
MDRQAKIRAILQRVAGNNKDLQPGLDESLFESGMLDSFALPDLVGAIEEEFGVKIPDSDLIPSKFETISRIEKYLDTRS